MNVTWTTKYHTKKIQIDTKNLKIDSEMAEKLYFKDGTDRRQSGNRIVRHPVY